MLRGIAVLGAQDGARQRGAERHQARPTLLPHLFRQRLRQQGGGEGKTDAKNLKVTNDTEKAENTNITVDGNKKEGDEKGEKKPIGDLKFDVEGMKGVVVTVKDESTADDAINSAAEGAAPAMGEVIDGDSAPPKEEKKKGLFGKLNDKFNAGVNKVRDKIKSGFAGVKKWFNSQNKVVKILICAIIAVLAIVGIYFLFTAVIWPILYGILHGGIINAAIGIFRIYASGKTFVATYKQGKKSWESGEGWGKTFLMIGMSILAIVNLGQMAAQGNAMMAADAAKNASKAAGEAAAEGGKSAASSANSGGYSLKAGETVQTPNGPIKITGFRSDGGVNVEIPGTDGSTGMTTISAKDIAGINSNEDKIKLLSKFAKLKGSADLF